MSKPQINFRKQEVRLAHRLGKLDALHDLAAWVKAFQGTLIVKDNLLDRIEHTRKNLIHQGEG